ncbi:MAG: quinoprotein dehydrogenase-associated putative ABC transporter substrate-binding protein [Betaproteobacteria bacterium]
MAQSQAAADPPRKALRVCQDPNNMPFSSVQGQGIENRIAEVFGKKLNLPVTYYSYPQRFAFVRNTLRFKLPDQDYPCDIMMGVPAGFDQVSVTKPYYRSSYALVFPLGIGLDHVRSAADFLRSDPALLRKLRIGIYDKSPATPWVHAHGLVDQTVVYKMLDADPEQYPGQIIDTYLQKREIDVAVVWGPIAGYFAMKNPVNKLQVIALPSEPGVQFDYAIAMGVRYGERQWKEQVESLIDRSRSEIQAILREFGVPLVEEPDARPNSKP